MPATKTLRLILGDQLNYKHSWFKRVDPHTTYLIMEMKQETGYVLHHAAKIIGFFAAMYNFAAWLRKNGHPVIHLLINDHENHHDLPANLTHFLKKTRATRFEYMLPDEYRLDQQLKSFIKDLDISHDVVDTEHFLTARGELRELMGGDDDPIMETFYRRMRRRHQILLQPDGHPEGGGWNFDKENRKPLKTRIPPPSTAVSHDYSDIWQEITTAGISSFGNPGEQAFKWPTTRREGLKALDDFIHHHLAYFGPFQDAMQTGNPFLFHSRLSFALNTKMISPLEVIKKVEAAYLNGKVPLASAEGYIRQILGWREYMRGIYWMHMPGYKKLNFFQHRRKLPGWFWTAETKMNCLRFAIGQSLEKAYAHHIQRLMIIGNFALLAGLHPDEVDAWYLGVYIDAIEWVEITNTRGMSQYADGGIAGTKPYVSSASYIHKMSNYCDKCSYDRNARTGPRACPYNSLYWDFHDRHRKQLEHHPRIGFVYNTWDKMDAGERKDTLVQAKHYLSRLEEL